MSSLAAALVVCASHLAAVAASLLVNPLLRPAMLEEERQEARAVSASAGESSDCVKLVLSTTVCDPVLGVCHAVNI